MLPLARARGCNEYLRAGAGVDEAHFEAEPIVPEANPGRLVREAKHARMSLERAAGGLMTPSSFVQRISDSGH